MSCEDGASAIAEAGVILRIGVNNGRNSQL